MPPLQQPCDAIGNTIICLLNEKGEKEETPEYYDIRYADYREALMENNYQKIYYIGLSFPKYKFELDFELPSNLSSLSLTGCKIKSLNNLIFPDNLINLNLSNNYLRKIPEKLPNGLLKLDVSNNNIRRVWKYPPKLEEFYCKKNNIKIIPDTFPETLKKVNLSYNLIEILPKEIPKDMKILEIQDNAITELPKSIANCNEIEVQWENNIVTILPVEIYNVLLTQSNNDDYRNFIINKNV